MTAPINTPATSTAKDAASARKRRRRAPAGGAADDCFTCAKRNVKCDRRRPYCSQCLEIGNECSGYKTQLTWGVGVASRGKLRGLSLPIAKAPPVNPGKSVKSPTTVRARTGSVASTAQWPAEQDDRSVRDEVEANVKLEMGHRRNPSISVTTTSFHSYDMSHLSPTETAPPGWTHIPFSSNMTTNGNSRFSPRPLHIPVTSPGDMMQREMMQTPIDPMSDMDYMSPLGHSFPREEMPSFIHSPMVYENFPSHASPVPQSPVAAMMIEHTRAPGPCPSLGYAPSEPASSLHSHLSHVDSLEAQLSRKMPHDCDVLVSGTPEMDTYGSSVQSHGPFWSSSSADDESVSQSIPDRNPAPWPGSFPSQSPSPVLQVSPDLITKMPFFMDYYEKSMCPSMVFIDGPNNPFREHILRLGTSSRSLQHAICALAACNLRMKRRLSLGHQGRDMGERRLDMSPIDSGSDVQPSDQSLAEEYQHRNLAVRLLNEQLNDAEKSMHDSVLATILLLCHYRMAESGVAKFQTQFAGVRKILGLRRMSPYPASRDSAWMEALFTYFDAISASVNDREPQLTASFYGVSPDAQLLPPGAENLVGCDRELFKTVSKLGRLNLLSQHRPVQHVIPSSPLPRISAPRSESPLGGSDHHQHHHSIFGGLPHPINSSVRFDGNGFSTTNHLEDDDMLNTTTTTTTTHLHSPTAYDDPRSMFWREWKEARQALQTWEFDAARVRASLTAPPSSSQHTTTTPSSPGPMSTSTSSLFSAPPPQQPTGGQVRDLGSLSEAFRYAALLYTERLASPNVPSNHNNFRNLVSQVVYYATSLEAGSAAEKFLLWPLFVAGSECVNELQQNIVRSKCREIMARSGYMNNLAALDVLERLWAGEGGWREDVLRNHHHQHHQHQHQHQQQHQQQQQQQHHHARMVGNGKGGPFNWARCIGGPGVEVEWIMF
ncbi:fungal-specific transcription factor domain-containing protein [Chaetomidium leptoderma]|uniref:Fungal-specific transcription factor domain-containing protein n=1 Tax=Chaetomidium leptoderma TaxID=669021 RepID=A0AAN6VQJ4_9PEZI|nr:fungal-specific transcription factor domain-containing protein [Chaetomidium leptoderma]